MPDLLAGRRMTPARSSLVELLALRVLELQERIDAGGSGGGGVDLARVDALETTVEGLQSAVSGLTPGLEDRVDAVESEVDQITDTIEAPTVGEAPKPTPRTDALEVWRATAEAQIVDIVATVAAIDVPAAVQAWLTVNPPPAGSPGQDGADGAPGAEGKSAYQLARDGGYGGTQTQWLASLAGAQGPPGADSTVPGPKGDKGDVGNAGPPGADSTVPGPAGAGFAALAKVAADQAFTTTSLANVAGLSWSVAANTAYRFDLLLSITSAALTTGWQFGFTGPTSPTSFLAVQEFQSSATVWTSATLTAFGGFTLVTAAYAAAPTPILVRISGLLVNGNNAGTVQLQCRSEVASSAITVKRGSTLLVS